MEVYPCKLFAEMLKLFTSLFHHMLKSWLESLASGQSVFYESLLINTFGLSHSDLAFILRGENSVFRGERASQLDRANIYTYCDSLLIMLQISYNVAFSLFSV